MTLKLLTHSRIKSARSCQRLHHYLYDLGIRPVRESDALRFGSLVHLGLEGWWKAVAAGASGDDLLAAAFANLQGEADVYERARAEEVLRGYHFRWLDTVGNYEVIGVELQFRAPLVNPQTGRASRIWELGGKLDVLVYDRVAQQKALIEHKTSSEDLSEGSEYWRRLTMDGQVSIYYEGAASLGHPVGTCIYDVLRKPALRPSDVPVVDDQGCKVVLDAAGNRVRTKDGKKWRETGDAAQGYVLQVRPETADEFRLRVNAAIAEAPEKYYRRGQVVRLEGEVEEALLDVWQVAQQVHEASITENRDGTVGRFPRNPDACASFGVVCPFLDVCAKQASLDDPSRFKRLENVHPELSEAVSQ